MAVQILQGSVTALGGLISTHGVVRTTSITAGSGTRNLLIELAVTPVSSSSKFLITFSAQTFQTEGTDVTGDASFIIMCGETGSEVDLRATYCHGNGLGTRCGACLLSIVYEVASASEHTIRVEWHLSRALETHRINPDSASHGEHASLVVQEFSGVVG